MKYRMISTALLPAIASATKRPIAPSGNDAAITVNPSNIISALKTAASFHVEGACSTREGTMILSAPGTKAETEKSTRGRRSASKAPSLRTHWDADPGNAAAQQACAV